MRAQEVSVHNQPVVDSATQSSPLDPAAHAPAAVDSATQSSPAPAEPRTETIPAGAKLQVALSRALNSGSTHNGDTASGALRTTVRTSTGRTLAAGTAVTVTVLAAVAAGKLESSGELTLQLTRVGSINVLSDFVTRRGQAGTRVEPDSAPAKGTEAMLDYGATLDFTIPPNPAPAGGGALSAK